MNVFLDMGIYKIGIFYGNFIIMKIVTVVRLQVFYGILYLE